jgi:hypothetical protein
VATLACPANLAAADAKVSEARCALYGPNVRVREIERHRNRGVAELPKAPREARGEAKRCSCRAATTLEM